MNSVCPKCGSTRTTCWIITKDITHCICYNCNEEWVE